MKWMYELCKLIHCMNLPDSRYFWTHSICWKALVEFGECGQILPFERSMREGSGQVLLPAITISVRK